MVCAGITYNATSNRIEVVYNASDGTRGASWTDPYTLQDVYDTDVANGWGFWTNTLDHYSVITAYLYIAGTATFFKIENQSLQFSETTQYCLYTNKAKIKIISSFIYGGKRDLMLWTNTAEEALVEDCLLTYINYVIFRPATVRKTKLTRLTTRPNIYSGSVLYYVDFSIIGGYGLTPIGPFENTKIRFLDCTTELYFRQADSDITLRELEILNFSSIKVGFDTSSHNVYLIDCEIDETKEFEIMTSWLGYKDFQFKTTFKATVKDATGGKLTIYDKNGDEAYTETLASDSMTEQEITYGIRHTENLSGTGRKQAYTAYQPFSLKVTKEGFQELEIPDISVIAGQPTIIRGELVPVPATVFIDRRVQGAIAAKKIAGTASVKRLTGVVRQTVSISGTVRPLISITGHITKQEIEGEVKT